MDIIISICLAIQVSEVSQLQGPYDTTCMQHTIDECMLKGCDDCPSTGNLRKHILDSLLEGYGIDDDICFNQRENITNITTSKLNFHNFINEVEEKLSKITTTHHLISIKTE